MFDLNIEFNGSYDLIEISKDEKILLQDEFIILTLGKNVYNNFIISSIIEEDYDNNCLYYFHTLLKYDDYSSFIKKRITYFDIITSNKEIYISQKDYFNKIVKVYISKVEDIPEYYLPDKLSYYPIEQNEDNYQLELAFTGKNADLHELPLSTVNHTNKIIDKTDTIFRRLFKLDDYEMFTSLNAASFDMIYFYKIIESNNYKLFDDNETLSINIYFTKLVNFVFKQLNSSFKNDIFLSEDYHTLVKEFYSLVLISKKIKLTEIEFQKKFKNLIIDIIENFVDVTAITGKGFSELSISIDNNIDKTNKTKNIIQIINPNTINNIIENDKSINEFLVKDATYFTDDKPKHFFILIYQLNTETKKGNCYIEIKESNKRPKIPFVIKSNKSIIDSPITQSLAEEEIIEVNGFATYDENNKIKFLQILF